MLPATRRRAPTTLQHATDHVTGGTAPNGATPEPESGAWWDCYPFAVVVPLGCRLHAEVPC